MEIIIFDFEVYKYDTLLGAEILSNGSDQIFQSWDLSEIKKFYNQYLNSIWIGHNNARYDNLILEGVMEGKSESELKDLNDFIIQSNFRKKSSVPKYYYDLMSNHPASLKSLECFLGKNISETEVDFNINRKLTDEEKKSIEKYNRDDLEQTKTDFYLLKKEFDLRVQLIQQFHLSLSDLPLTGTQIAEKVLGARKINGIEDKVIPPYLFPNLELENKELLDYYFSEKFRTDEKLTINICGLNHQIGSGGIHAARKNCQYKKVLYLDVSGYYNLIMLNYDLLPRTIPEKGKQLYDFMYHEQLKLKGKPELAMVRSIYKVILLSVFGGMGNEYTKFYDPQKCFLVTICGQLFLVDLLEKLEGKIELIQSNTDGIMLIPSENSSEEEILDIVKKWCDRTKFVIKPKYIFNLVQRDVNNYIYVDEHDTIEAKGEAVKHFNGYKNPYDTDAYGSKEPLITDIAIVDYFTKNIFPEETIEKYKDNLVLFQYICKKNTFDYVEFETNDGKEIKSKRAQNVNRAFASNDKIQGMLYKYKNGGLKKTKISNLPENIFIYNSNIIDNVKEIQNKINYNYYIIRSYERILEFLGENYENKKSKK